MITVEENGIGGFGSHGGPSTQPASHLSTPLADALHAADQAQSRFAVCRFLTCKGSQQAPLSPVFHAALTSSTDTQLQQPSCDAQ